MQTPSVRSVVRSGGFVIALSLWGVSLAHGVAQQAEPESNAATTQTATTQTATTQEEAAVELPEIADQPRTIDPVTLLPEPLGRSVTVDLPQASLAEFAGWLRDEQGLTVLVDEAALAESDILPGDQVGLRLDNAPLYLALDRLRFREIGWYYEGQILYLTAAPLAASQLRTVPYNLGDLLDAGFRVDDLQVVVTSTIAPNNWEEVGGIGVLSFLGDVMFVRHNGAVQRRVQGLLAALRQPARRTFACEPNQNVELRARLEQKLTVDFDDTPLEDAIQQLADKTGADIRLDVPSLRELRIREREPVTLKLTDRKLKTVVESMVLGTGMTWMLEAGVLWVTTAEHEQETLKTAVYDVRDLARDEDESEALAKALMSQTNASSWDYVGGPGSMVFAKAGSLVVLNQEGVHADVLALLEAYRLALRQSKPRDREQVDPEEVITVYYRMPSKMATDLKVILPSLVEPESWLSTGEADAVGKILVSASRPEVQELKGSLPQQATDDQAATSLLISRSVLIITQTRRAHEEISQVIRQVEYGPLHTGAGGMGGIGAEAWAAERSVAVTSEFAEAIGGRRASAPCGLQPREQLCKRLRKSTCQT